MGRDLISSLPDEILGKILSSIPTKTAASTSVLSKRWRNLLCLVDNLTFDEEEEEEEEEEGKSSLFCDFVEKTFGLLLSNCPTIKKVSLSHTLPCDYPRVYTCIYTAMEQCGLLELRLHSASGYSCVNLKRELLTSNTLVKLTLSGDMSLEFRRVSFPALKSLSLISVSVLGCDQYCDLLDACPLLEDLYLRDDAHPYNPPCCSTIVMSDSIKRLALFTHLPDSQNDHDTMLLSLPSLVYLDYSSFVFEYHDCDGLDLLLEARLDLKLWEESTSHYDYSDDDDDDGYFIIDDDEQRMPIYGDVTKLVAGITNITTLYLSAHSLETFHFCCKSMPVFNNLLNLSIESDKEKGWHVIPALLKSCPRLHTFAIKGLVHRVTNKCGDACACTPVKHKKKEEEVVCCLLTCQLKVLEISDYRASSEEVKQMKHFLCKLKCLESVKVSVDAQYDNSQLLRDNLLDLPRISSKCNIQFV